MRHAVFGRKLSRTNNERRRLFAGLVRDLFIRNGIKTTIAKAKAVQPLVEKIITRAKKGGEDNRRKVDAVVTDRKITQMIFDESKTRFADRMSGFTRIIKLGTRRGDATEMALFTFVDERVVVDTLAPKKTKTTSVKAEEKKPAEAGKVKKVTAKKPVRKTAKKA